MQLETDAGGNCAFTPHVCCTSRPNNDVDWAAQESKYTLQVVACFRSF